MSIIYLSAASTNTDPGMTLVGGATIKACIDDAIGAPDDAVSYARGLGAAQTYWINPDIMPASVSIASVVLVTRMREAGGGANANFTPKIRIAGVAYNGVVYGNTAVTSWITQNDTWLTDPSTGLPWTTAGVNAITYGGTTAQVGDVMDISQQYLQVDFVPSSVRLGAARDNGSRLMRLFRRAVGTVELRAPLRFADAELLDDLAVTHFAMPTTHDYGAGSKVWQRAILRKLSEEVDLGSMTVKMSCLVLRDFLCLFWDTMVSEQPPGFSDGVARVDCGAGRLFTRASKAWIENAATALQGTKQVVEVTTNQEKNTTDGELFEGASTNSQIQASFANALTGWTSAGTGSNGSAIAADTTDLLYDSATSGNSIKFTAGNPIHVADLQITGTATAAIAANSIVALSIDHKDDSGAALSVAIQRGVDAKYFKNSDGTWQVAKTWNTITASTTSARWAANQIDVGAGATTLTVIVGIPTATGVAGQINHLYHVQLEVYRYPTSRIVTGAATVARVADLLTIENFHGKKVFINDRGYCSLTFTPEWNNTDLTGTPYLFIAYYDAGNLYRLFYNSATAAFVFRVRVGAVNVSASFAQVVTRGTPYELACRWVGADGEEDLAPYTISVFVNGVKGTDAVLAGIPISLPSAPLLYIGSDNTGANSADGWIRHFVIGQSVFSDEELADLP
jgi:hypothetical protein